MELIVGGGTPGAKQLEHDSVTPDSVRIGDGTDELLITAAGEANVKDASNDVARSTRASEATLSSIDGKIPALVSGNVPVTIQGASVTLNVDDTTISVSNFPATYPVTDNGGSLTVDDGGGSITVDGTFWQATQPVSGPLTDTQLRATAVPVSAASLPLPTGAATEATLAAQSAKLPATLGQKTMANSMSVTVASDQSSLPTLEARYVNGTQTTTTVAGTAATITAPATAVGFILEAADTNTANMRYRIGGTAATTNGMQLQPGRDTGYVPCAADISIISESGTNEYQIQWVQR